MITGARLRRGQTNSAKGAHRFVADTLVTAKAAGATGVLIARMDSAYYQSDVVAAVLRHKAQFSITARLLPPVRKAIDAIPADALDADQVHQRDLRRGPARWISEAEVAEVEFTAFSSKAKAKQVTARLIVRRVPDINPNNQSPLFTVYRHHAVFTNSPAADARRPSPPTAGTRSSSRSSPT